MRTERRYRRGGRRGQDYTWGQIKGVKTQGGGAGGPFALLAGASARI